LRGGYVYGGDIRISDLYLRHIDKMVEDQQHMAEKGPE
jgi:hypothetical protein